MDAQPKFESAAPEMAHSSPATPAKTQLTYRLSFTGTGSEYFKIWIVNLLLILITCGIYYPWAKLRKQKYLHRNLILDGAAFDYHAKPKALFIGMVVALLLSGTYYLMANLDSVAALLGITVVLSALVPWLVWKALRFRLAMTSYRALPFRFAGNLSDAYIMIVPQFMLLALVDWALMGVKNDAAEGLPPSLKWMGIIYLALMFLIPALHLFLKKYQHNNYQWTSLRTALDLGYKKIYFEYFIFALICVGIFILFFILIAIFISTMGLSVFSAKKGMGAFTFIAFVSIIPAYIAAYAMIASQFTSRFQNLIWNQTTAHGIVFISELNAWALFKLYFKNALLTLLTAGFYWPFAAMKVAQMRAASIRILATAPLMALAAAQLGEAREQNALGDAAGDVFGVDIGM